MYVRSKNILQVLQKERKTAILKGGNAHGKYKKDMDRFKL